MTCPTSRCALTVLVSSLVLLAMEAVPTSTVAAGTSTGTGPPVVIVNCDNNCREKNIFLKCNGNGTQTAGFCTELSCCQFCVGPKNACISGDIPSPWSCKADGTTVRFEYITVLDGCPCNNNKYVEKKSELPMSYTFTINRYRCKGWPADPNSYEIDESLP